MTDEIAVVHGMHAVGRQKERSLRQAVTSQMQQAHDPRQPCGSTQSGRSEEQGRAEHRNRHACVLSGGEAQHAPPILLLKGIEDREDRTQDASNDHDDRHAHRPYAAAGQPLQNASRERIEGGVEHDSGEDDAGSSAARTVSGGKPLVEWQHAELRAEAEEQEQSDDQCLRRRPSLRAQEAAEGIGASVVPEQQKREKNQRPLPLQAAPA